MKEGNNDTVDQVKPQSTKGVTQFIAYSSPIPVSSELEKYEKLVPGSVKRMLAEAEKENKHRHELEFKQLNANVKLSFIEAAERLLGQFFSFIISISCIFSGAYLVYKGRQISGTIFSGAGIASIIAIFYTSRIIRLFKYKK